MARNPTYSAFISYSHADQRLARWLHSSLETYRLPRAVRAKNAGKPRLGPVFLDQSDMGASPNLGDEVERALAASESLVVICSPASQQSRWVAAEVAYFVGLGRRDRIVLVLADGTPEESFPFEILDAARADESSKDPLQAGLPLAADARADDGSTRERQQKVRLAVVASILGVSRDELVRRHQQRQVRTLTLISAMSLVIAIAMAGLTWFAFDQRDRAEAEERNAQRRLADSKLQQGGALLATDRWLEGYAAFDEARELMDDLGMPQIALGMKLVEAEQRSITPFRYLELPGVDDLKTSHDGTRLAVLADRTVHVFDLTVDRKIKSYDFGHIEIGALALSEDGSMIAVGSDEQLLLLAVENGEQFPVPWTATSVIAKVDFAFGSPRVFVAEQAGRVLVWTLGEDEPVTLAEEDAAVADMRTSADDTVLAVAWADGTTLTCQIHDATCADPVAISAGKVTSLALSPDGAWLTTTDGEFLRFWNAFTGEFLSESPTESDHVQFAGGIVMASDREGGVTVFDPESGLRLARFNSPPTIAENRVAFSRYRLALLSSFDNGVLYWQMVFGTVPGSGDSLRSLESTQQSDMLEAVSISRDGALVAGGFESGEILVWDAFGLLLLTTIDTRGSGIAGLVFVDSGRQLVSISDDGPVSKWNLLTGKPTSHYSNAPGSPSAITTTADGSRIAVGSKSGRIAILDTLSGESIVPEIEVEGLVASLSFAADDSWLAIGTEGGRLYVWSAANQALREITRLGSGTEKGQLRVASRQSDQAFIVLQSAELWDVGNATRLQTFGSELTDTWHAGLIGADLIYTGGIDSFTVFDAESRSEIATIKLDTGVVLIDGISASDGKVFAAQDFWSADLYRWQEAVTRAELRNALTSIDLMQDRTNVAERVELLARWYLSHGFLRIGAKYLSHPEFEQRSMTPLSAARILLADGQIEPARVQLDRAVAIGEIPSVYAELMLSVDR